MLPSGTIKMSEVRAELKTTGSINLGRTDVRNLAKKLSGIIKMSDLHGKSAATWVKVANNKSFSSQWGGTSPGEAANVSINELKSTINKFVQSNYNKIITVGVIKGEYLSTDKLCKVVFLKDIYTAVEQMGGSNFLGTSDVNVDIYLFQ